MRVIHNFLSRFKRSFLRAVLLGIAGLAPLHGFATTYSIPASFGSGAFAACSASTLICTGSLTIANADTVNVTTSMTLQVTGSLSIGNNATITVANGQVFNLVVAGSVSIGNSPSITANITATGPVTLGNSGSVFGNIKGASLVVGTTLVNGACTPGNSQCVGSFTVSKVASATNIPAYTNFTYTLSAVNTTSSSIANVALSDNLNTPGLTFVTCVSAVGVCTYSSGVVTWTIGSVAANTTLTANLTVQAASAGSYTNLVSANTSGSPASSTTVQVYSPLGDWRMDETLWSGAAGEVKDSSGNGNNGTAARAIANGGLPTTASATPAYTNAGRSTCSYGVFGSPTNSYGYVSLSKVPVLPTSFTFTAWIRTTSPGQSGQRILVRDDAQDGWGFSLGDGGNGRIRFFNRNIASTGPVSGNGVIGCTAGSAPFCLDTAAVITANNWFFIAVSVDTVGKVVTHYVYDASGNLVSSTSAAFSGTWKDGTGLAAIGGETSASQEGIQSAFHFQGNIDELQIYQGVLSQADFALLRTRSRTCLGAGPDHVELVQNGSGLNCSPKPITVLGCTVSTSCSASPADQYVGNVTLTPNSFSGAQWCADAACNSPLVGAITIGSGSTIYLREPTARTDLLGGGVSGALNTTLQCKNSTTAIFGTSPAACNISFSSAGFLINAPSHTSCVPQTVTIQAVQANSNATACIPAFANANRTINMYSQYTNPAVGTTNVSFNFVNNSGGATTAVGALSTNSLNPSTLANLYFDGTGTATLKGFVYPDVGQVTLMPSYSGSASTNDTGLSLYGVSGASFIAVPASMVVAAPSPPLTAGTPFAATITSFNACATPAVTTNFGNEATPATATLTVSNPQPGQGNAPVVPAQTVSGFTNGVASTNVTWMEVGTVDLTASVTNYLSSGLGTTSSVAKTVGRFKPDHFDTAVTPGCNTFTYSGQPMMVKVTAKASSGSAVTSNYAGIAWAQSVNVNGGTGTWSANSISPSAFALGQGSANAAIYSFATKPSVPTTIAVGAIETTGSDAVSTSPNGSTANVTISSGRVHMLNAYGSELLDLPLSMHAEVWNGTGWTVNTADKCTTTVLSATNVVNSVKSKTCVLEAANNSGYGCAKALTSLQVNRAYLQAGLNGTDSNGVSGFAGNFNLWLQAPGQGNTGAIDVTAAVPAWLQFNWSGSVGNPVGRATFGAYKSPLIYRRENY